MRKSCAEHDWLVLNYPDDLADSINVTPDELAALVRLMASLKMFELGKISSAKAAELAGLSRADFYEACARYRVSAFNYGDDAVEAELLRDIAAAGKRNL
jgi:predicted HTH domain antitoxin